METLGALRDMGAKDNLELTHKTLWGLLWGLPACGALLPFVGSPPFN
jgi:hypothetical protein